jgi:hypothetical protein
LDNPLNRAFQLADLRRVTLFVGAYGSGKSEISVNFAGWLAEVGWAVTLCDLDIINPYYRSADARAMVEAQGIRLISPPFAGTNVDVPAVPAAVYSIFDDTTRKAVLDIGGEDMGARVVATLRKHLAALAEPPAVYMVVNTCRPFTDTPAKIAATAHMLADAAGWPLSGLVHNANLLGLGNAELLVEHWPTVREAAELLDLPVVFAAAMAGAVPADWLATTPQGIPLLRLRRSIWYPQDR